MLIDTLPPQQIEYMVLQNARSVYDISTFYFTDYAMQNTAEWAIVKVTPDLDSGSATIPGGYINGENGKVVIPANTAMVISKKGKWELLSASQPGYPASGIYNWTQPVDQSKRVLGAEDFYSPFSYGGIIIYKPNLAGNGLDQFLHSRLIFTEWKNMIQSAFDSSRKDYDILDGKATKNDKTVLNDMVSQSNAFLSLLALRALFRLELVQPASCANFLRTKDLNLISVFVNLIITSTPANQHKQWMEELIKVIKSSRDEEYLKHFGVGAFSVIIFNSQIPSGADAKSILRVIFDQVKSIGMNSKQVPDLYYMFEKSGIY